MKDLRNIQATLNNSILLVIDMQKEKKPWKDKERGLYAGAYDPKWELSTMEAIVPAVQPLVDRAHEAGIPVIYVQSIRNHREPEFTVFEHPLMLQIGTWHSEFFDELIPEPRDFVVRKWSHDPWYETDLERILDGLVSDPTKCQAIITGGAITGCAGFGTAGFFIRNYQAVVVLDAVYGGPAAAANYFSRTSYPTFANVYLTKSNLIHFSNVAEPVVGGL